MPPQYKAGPSEAGWHMTQSAYHCMKEFQLANIRHIVPAQKAQLEDPLGVGIMFHSGRAEWFERGFGTDTKTMTSINDAMLKDAEKQRLPVSKEAKERAHALIAAYVEHYSLLPKPKVKCVETEIGPAKLLPNSLMYRTARPDDVSEYPEAGGALMIGDAKTTSDDMSTIAKQYELHGQTMLGIALWKVAKQGEAKFGPVQGYMLDVVKKPYGSDKAKFGRFPIFITDWQLSWFLPDMERLLIAAASVDWDTKTMRNPTACQRVIGRRMVSCPYLELCKTGRSATIKYQFEDGRSLTAWKPEAGRVTPPWE